MQTTTVSIFNYEDPAQYLRDCWNTKRGFNKNFTLRSWANQLGFSSHGTLYQIVKGMRPLPKKYVQPLSHSLKLDSKESLYLETLVDFSKAKTLEHKSFYRTRLNDLAPTQKLSFYEIEALNYIKDPLNGAILELTSLKDFSSDPLWIKSRIRINRTAKQITDAIQLLFDLKLIELINGEIKRTKEHVFTTSDIKNEAIQEHHKNVLTMGIEEISKQGVLTREYNASSFGIKHEDLPRAKEKLREVLSDFIKEFEAADGEAEDIYQLGIQFFGITKQLGELK